MLNSDIELIFNAFIETILLTFVPLFFSAIFGFIIGTLVFISGNDLVIKERSKILIFINRLADMLINIFRAIPYMILLLWAIPIAIALTGTMLGVKGAIPSLVLSATPFFARMVIIAFKEVDKGTIEAAHAMGATTLDIIFKVLFEESLPTLVSSLTVTAINLVSYSTMAAAIGSGGLGYIAYHDGYLRNKTYILFIATILILIIVFAIQIIGDKIAKSLDRR